MLKEIKKFISFVKYVSIGFIISLIIISIMKLLTYIGLSYNIASTISALSILIIPISVGYWIFKEIKLFIKTIPNTTLR